jgi:hypothetical protein
MFLFFTIFRRLPNPTIVDEHCLHHKVDEAIVDISSFVGIIQLMYTSIRNWSKLVIANQE